MRATAKTALFAAAIATAAMMQGCAHKDLCYDHSHVVDLRVDFDWSLAPDATPRTMVVRLFRPDGSHYAVHEFTSAESGHIRVEAGDYMILCHNGEMENVLEGGDSFSDYHLATKARALLSPMGRADAQAPPRLGASTSEPVRNTPEQVWAGCCTSLSIQPRTEGQSVTLRPAEATAHYTVTIYKVENLTAAIDISGAITGMSEQWNVAAARPSGITVTHPVAFERLDEHTLRAEFHAFGHCHESETPHYFSVYTSNNVYKDFEITEQLHGAQNPREVNIEIEGLTLPPQGTGIQPGISGWDNVVDTEIDMH